MWITDRMSWTTASAVLMIMRMHEPSRTEQRSDPIWAEYVMPDDSDDQHKDPLAVEFGRRGGLKGGHARAAKLSPDERAEAARKAAAARWGVKAETLSATPSEVIAASSSNLIEALAGQKYGTIVADPPWRFINRTGKIAPEHKRLARYETMSTSEISALPVADVAADRSHLYLWAPNALVPEAFEVMRSWGFTYKSMLVWHKVRKDGGSDGRGVGFYFRNVTETVLFGVRGRLRTFQPGRSQVNLIATRKREHSRKPDELYPIIEACSPGPFLELFARYPRPGWSAWGNEAPEDVVPKGRIHRGYGAKNKED
jgi:N6-adenosine-specific RNA methylase IME4